MCFREFEESDRRFAPHCPGAGSHGPTGQKAQVENHRRSGRRPVLLAARIHAFPSFGPDGEINGFIEVVEDITQSKQAEMALRESEQRFRLMAETIQDVFWIATPTLDRVIYASPAFEQVWGRTCQELYQYPNSLWKASIRRIGTGL